MHVAQSFSMFCIPGYLLYRLNTSAAVRGVVRVAGDGELLVQLVVDVHAVGQVGDQGVVHVHDACIASKS